MGKASKERMLYGAAMSNDGCAVRRLLSEGADQSYVFSREFRINCLQVAAKFGSAQALEELLSDPRSDPRYADLMWNTALIYAAEQGNGLPGLQLPPAGAQGYADCVSILCGSSDLEHKQRMGRTALHCAAEADSPQLCALLVRAGAALDAVDNQGNSPLSLAARGNRAAAVRFLLPFHEGAESLQWIGAAARNARNSGYGRLAEEIEGFGRALEEKGEIGEGIPRSAGAKRFRI